MCLKNKTYDILKNITQIVLPALATLYVTVSKIWNISFSKEICATITAFNTFLGAIMMISSNNYKKE